MQPFRNVEDRGPMNKSPTFSKQNCVFCFKAVTGSCIIKIYHEYLMKTASNVMQAVKLLHHVLSEYCTWTSPINTIEAIVIFNTTHIHIFELSENWQNCTRLGAFQCWQESTINNLLCSPVSVKMLKLFSHEYI